MSSFEILLYNKIQLDDGTQGIVRYMGNIMGKKGIFYGIDITKGDAKNDGSFKSIKYFDTKKGTKTGRFCKENKITKCKKTTFSKYPFKLGDIVMCTKTKCKGTIKYVGVPSWAKGGKVYYGLQLSKKKGTGNGTNQGVQYFQAKMGYGIYVPVKDVKKVGGKKKKEASKDDDVKDAMRDYYKSKSKQETPKSIKKSKSKKKVNNKKKSGKKKGSKKPENKLPVNEPIYDNNLLSTDSIEPGPMSQLHDATVSVDYMDEEKDGIDLDEYQNKTEEMDYSISEKQRKERNETMKQMEREERLARQQEKEQEKQKQAEKQQLLTQENAEKQQKEILKREKELKDKERLQQYAQAMREKEEADKLQQAEEEELEQQRIENELIKQKELEAVFEKEEQEREERDNERKLAEKLRKEKEAKLKQEEEKYTQPVVVISTGGGSIKDRMAMFQKQNNSTPKKTVASPKAKPEQKRQYSAPKVNNSGGGGVGAAVGADKAINFELQNALGKPLASVKMTKVAGYSGQIPLVLYLLGQKLIKLDKFGTFKIFHPEEMEKQADKVEMQYANNIFVFFASLPEPLLHTTPQDVLMKAINKDVMKDVVSQIKEPYASALTYLWDILARVAMNPNARMGGQSLGKVFGPMCTMITQQDVKGNRVSMNALGASRMMAFFRRGIEWRMEVQGYKFEDSDDSD